MGYGKITASFTRKTVSEWIDTQWKELVKIYPEYDEDPDHMVNGIYGGKKRIF